MLHSGQRQLALGGVVATFHGEKLFSNAVAKVRVVAFVDNPARGLLQPVVFSLEGDDFLMDIPPEGFVGQNLEILQAGLDKSRQRLAVDVGLYVANGVDAEGLSRFRP